MIKLYYPQCIFCNIVTPGMYSIAENPTNICHLCAELIKVFNHFLFDEYRNERIFRAYRGLDNYLNNTDFDNNTLSLAESLANFKTEIKNSGPYRVAYLQSSKWYSVVDLDGKLKPTQYEVGDPEKEISRR